MAVEHGEVQQVVMDTGDTETIFVLLPEAQNRRTANPGQTDLRESGLINSPIIHLFIHVFIHSSCYLWNGFSIFDTGGQQDGFFYPVVPDTERVPGDQTAAAIAIETERPACLPHANRPAHPRTHLQDNDSITDKVR